MRHQQMADRARDQQLPVPELAQHFIGEWAKDGSIPASASTRNRDLRH
jgi:hypothetical protein